MDESFGKNGKNGKKGKKGNVGKDTKKGIVSRLSRFLEYTIIYKTTILNVQFEMTDCAYRMNENYPAQVSHGTNIQQIF